MDLDDEITVAQPDHMSIGFLTSSTESTFDRTTEGENASYSDAEYQPSSGDSSAPEAVTSNPANGSRDSTPLSDIDEEILKKAPTSLSRQVAYSEGLFALLPASPYSSNKPPAASNSAFDHGFSPQPTEANEPRKHTRTSRAVSGAIRPPPKRQRGRPRTTTLKDSTLSQSQLNCPGQELALNDTEDDLGVRPGKNQLLGNGSTRTNRVGTRARMGRLEDSDEYSVRLRTRQAEKKRYKPLRLYEGSNWVLFDPNKSFSPEWQSPPEFMHDYKHYKPGNDRVLEYNLVSNSVRIKSTPKVLKGKLIRYEQDGPKLAK